MCEGGAKEKLSKKIQAIAITQIWVELAITLWRLIVESPMFNFRRPKLVDPPKIKKKGGGL